MKASPNIPGSVKAQGSTTVGHSNQAHQISDIMQRTQKACPPRMGISPISSGDKQRLDNFMKQPANSSQKQGSASSHQRKLIIGNKMKPPGMKQKQSSMSGVTTNIRDG